MWLSYSILFTLNRVKSVGIFGNYEFTMNVQYGFVFGLK